MNDQSGLLSEAENCYQRKEFQVAFDKYLKLAQEGHVQSQVFVGWMYAAGIGTSIDNKKASLWFERAAVLGSMEGEFYYGRHLTSIGKHNEAIKWYKSAAKKGDIPSTFRLGLSLIKGKGVPIDIPSGYKHLITAADHGHIFALREIGVLDIKGNRGIMCSIKGFWVLFYAIFLGMIEGYFVGRHSVKLRG